MAQPPHRCFQSRVGEVRASQAQDRKVGPGRPGLVWEGRRGHQPCLWPCPGCHVPAGPPGEPGSRGGVPGGNSRTLWLELSRPRLGAALSPCPFSQVGGAGWKGGGTSKGGCRRAPRCSLSSQQAPPPEPGASPVSRGGGQEHLALRTRGRKWGWQAGGAPPCIPTLTLSTACKAFLSGWLRAGGGWRGGRERHRWGP